MLRVSTTLSPFVEPTESPSRLYSPPSPPREPYPGCNGALEHSFLFCSSAHSLVTTTPDWSINQFPLLVSYTPCPSRRPVIVSGYGQKVSTAKIQMLAECLCELDKKPVIPVRLIHGHVSIPVTVKVNGRRRFRNKRKPLLRHGPLDDTTYSKAEQIRKRLKLPRNAYISARPLATIIHTTRENG